MLAIFPGKLAVTTSLSQGTSVGQGFLIELFLNFQLLVTIQMLAGEKHAATFMAPIGIGLSLFIAELSGVSFTGGSLNPARSFGPALVLGDFPNEHWIYWAGPAAGSVLAAGLYKFLKILVSRSPPTSSRSAARISRHVSVTMTGGLPNPYWSKF